MQTSGIVQFDRVSKRFYLGSRRVSLREMLTGLPSRVTGKPARYAPKSIWALRDVGFEIEQGETLGIVGHNGAGKSTILRLIARITQPTSGSVSVRGRVSPMIELGAGFHPDLTGRENIYLRGAILGLKRAEIAARFDRIVAFSELETFLDTPVKRYSSGMYARLGFSIAAHVEPQVLLVDEVLSVGDQSFQTRCISKMLELQRTGVTIVMVSHDLHAIHEVCSQALLLWHGEVKMIGRPADAVSEYLELVRVSEPLPDTSMGTGYGVRRGSHEAVIEGVKLLDEAGAPTSLFKTGDAARVRMTYRAPAHAREPQFLVRIHRDDGMHCFTATTKWDGVETASIGDGEVIEFRLPRLTLRGGNYLLSVGVLESAGLRFYDLHEKAYPFSVVMASLDQGVFDIAHEWRISSRNPDQTEIRDAGRKP